MIWVEWNSLSPSRGIGDATAGLRDRLRAAQTGSDGSRRVNDGYSLGLIARLIRLSDLSSHGGANDGMDRDMGPGDSLIAELNRALS